jgi:type I restriction enzyme M protein
MAVSEKPGKDKSGRLIYQIDSSGVVKIDEYGRPKVDSDLSDIAKEVVTGNCKIGFWVNRRDLVGRINAEFYNPKYMEIRGRVASRDYSTLGALLVEEDGIINGKDLSAISNDGKRHYDEDGLPYLRVGDVRENEIDLLGAEKIDPSKYDISSLPVLELGDLLVTRKGTTGRAAVVSKDELDVMLSSEIIRLRLKETHKLSTGRNVRINPYYVAAYLNSPIGKALVLQKQTGGISEGINHPDLMEIEVALPEQKEMDRIAATYKFAKEGLHEARSKIDKTAQDIARLLT